MNKAFYKIKIIEQKLNKILTDSRQRMIDYFDCWGKQNLGDASDSLVFP